LNFADWECLAVDRQADQVPLETHKALPIWKETAHLHH